MIKINFTSDLLRHKFNDEFGTDLEANELVSEDETFFVEGDYDYTVIEAVIRFNRWHNTYLTYERV